MADNVTNELLLEHMKRLQSDMSAVKSDVVQIKAELVAVKTHIGALVTSSSYQDAAFIELTSRVERLERRLELREDA